MKHVFSKLKKDGIYIIEDIYNFDPQIFNDPFTSTVELQYIEIPNPKNTSDNNILVVRNKGYPIPSL
jgi:hypothetical protein